MTEFNREEFFKYDKSFDDAKDNLELLNKQEFKIKEYKKFGDIIHSCDTPNNWVIYNDLVKLNNWLKIWCYSKQDYYYRNCINTQEFIITRDKEKKVYVVKYRKID